MGDTDTDADDAPREYAFGSTDATVPGSTDATAASPGEGRRGLWTRYRGLPGNVLAISVVSLLNDASSEIIYPLLPVFLSMSLGASPIAIGIIEGAAESLSSLLKLFAGYWSDRRGRRKGLVVFGYSLA